MVMEKERVILFCEARSVPPVISYTWTRTGASQARVVSSDQKLTIESASSADCGHYRCRATNTLGDGESSEVSVEVKCESTMLHHHPPQDEELTSISLLPLS